MAWTSSAHSRGPAAFERARARRSKAPAGTTITVQHEPCKEPYAYRVVEYRPGEQAPELGLYESSLGRHFDYRVLASAPAFAVVEYGDELHVHAEADLDALRRIA